MSLATKKQEYLDAEKQLLALKAEAGKGDDFDLMNVKMDVLKGETEAEREVEYRAILDDFKVKKDKYITHKELDEAESDLDANTKTRVDWQNAAPAAAMPGVQYKSLGEAVVESKSYQERDWTNKEAAVSFRVAVPRSPFEMKASFDSSFVGFTHGQLLANDRIRQPLFVRRGVLDLLTVTTNDNSNIRWQMMSEGSTAAANRERGAAIAKGNDSSAPKTADLRSIGYLENIARETMADHARMRGELERIMRNKMTKQEKTQVVSGNGTDPNWHGMEHPDYLGTVRNNNGANGGRTYTLATAVDASNDSVLSVGSGDSQETAYAFLRKRIRALEVEYDIAIDAILCDAAVAEKILNVLEDKRQTWDYVNQPDGAVRGVPVIPTSGLAADTLIIGAFGSEMELATRGMIEVAYSDDYAFGDNANTVRMLIEGELLLYNPFAFERYSHTNLLG